MDIFRCFYQDMFKPKTSIPRGPSMRHHDNEAQPPKMDKTCEDARLSSKTYAQRSSVMRLAQLRKKATTRTLEMVND